MGRRILNFGITLIVLASIATSIYFIFMKEPQEKDSTYTANIVVGTNQELLVGQITNMNGNEMDFDIVEEASFDMEQTGSGTGERPSGNASRGGKPTGENQEETISGNVTMPEGEIPEGMTMPEGEIPEGMTMPEGGIPEGMTMPEGEMPEGMTISGQDGGSDKDSDITVEEAITIYQSTGETKSLQIPVGTEVVTKLGNTTTFSRLAVGDVVNLLLEKADNGETIVKIWIVG